MYSCNKSICSSTYISKILPEFDSLCRNQSERAGNCQEHFSCHQTGLWKRPLANQMKPSGPDTHPICRPSSWELQEAYFTSQTNTVEFRTGLWSWSYGVFTLTSKRLNSSLLVVWQLGLMACQKQVWWSRSAFQRTSDSKLSSHWHCHVTDHDTEQCLPAWVGYFFLQNHPPNSMLT